MCGLTTVSLQSINKAADGELSEEEESDISEKRSVIVGIIAMVWG